jgi:pimeloyl-ACP methyl ester carboxylesterase
LFLAGGRGCLAAHKEARMTDTQPEFLDTPAGRRIGYHRHGGVGPGVVFLGGFASDMTGTKAAHLDAWARARGRAFLRFDYSGHGVSSGDFAAGCIGDWAADALAVLEMLTDGPQILVGSSMGGWIALLLARAMPDRVAGLVTIAAAPDFTDDMWAAMDGDTRSLLAQAGAVDLPSDYGAPLPVTARLIEDGRAQRVFDAPLPLPFPVRFLQGTADAEVPVAKALRLLDHADGDDMRLTLVKGADHRFSSRDCLSLIEAAIAEVSG